MIQDIIAVEYIAGLVVTIAGVIRFFKYTDERLKHDRAQTALLAQIARQQNEPKDATADNEISKIIGINGLGNAVQLPPNQQNALNDSKKQKIHTQPQSRNDVDRMWGNDEITEQEYEAYKQQFPR